MMRDQLTGDNERREMEEKERELVMQRKLGYARLKESGPLSLFKMVSFSTK